MAASNLKHGAMFRLPRVYRFAVRYLVAATLMMDTHIMATRSGRMPKLSKRGRSSACHENHHGSRNTYAEIFCVMTQRYFVL